MTDSTRTLATLAAGGLVGGVVAVVAAVPPTLAVALVVVYAGAFELTRRTENLRRPAGSWAAGRWAGLAGGLPAAVGFAVLLAVPLGADLRYGLAMLFVGACWLSLGVGARLVTAGDPPQDRTRATAGETGSG